MVAGWVGRVGMPSKVLKPTIPDSQGHEASSNKLVFNRGGYSTEFKCLQKLSG